MTEVNTKWFKFHQNNSGGHFHTDKDMGLGVNVWVEAIDSDHANLRAEQIGIYFNGVDEGMDCECCGDRWSEAWENDGEDFVNISTKFDFGWSKFVFVHPINGSFISVNKNHLTELPDFIKVDAEE